jgi:hypothetical protein
MTTSSLLRVSLAALDTLLSRTFGRGPDGRCTFEEDVSLPADLSERSGLVGGDGYRRFISTIPETPFDRLVLDFLAAIPGGMAITTRF